jgi:hypothetical protein
MKEKETIHAKKNPERKTETEMDRHQNSVGTW